MKFDFDLEDRLIRLICLSVSFCTVACSSQKTQDLVSSLVGTTAAVPPTSGAAFSNPAFSFLPGLYDFGGKILNSVSTIGVTVRNVSGQSLYLASITSPSVHYTISSSTCPLAPAPIAADATCLVTVQFSPKSAGSLGSNLQLYFSTGTTAGASVYLSAGTALLGTGLTTLSFAGLQAISGVTTSSMVLSWSADPVASAYMVYQIQAGSMVYLKTVNNVGGSVSGTVMTGLTPNTPYTFRVRGIDSVGSAESNTVDVSATTQVPGAFTTATLNVAEGATASLNLSTLCTDLYSTAPSSFTLTAMTSANALPHCSIVGSNLQCSPDYKTGHAGWTETATVVCRINQSDLTQNFTLNVTDTNVPA
ncbi:MAG: fibronectin type III domain-containing protein, partial [Methylotenera sp.]|nr:fibronectin type III domain-containing protein [Oligoflexia bacterium]